MKRLSASIFGAIDKALAGQKANSFLKYALVWKIENGRAFLEINGTKEPVGYKSFVSNFGVGDKIYYLETQTEVLILGKLQDV